MSRFADLIDAVADQKKYKLSDVLLKAKVLAHSLKSRTFKQWVNSEIDGYSDISKLPDYRMVPAVLRGDFSGPIQMEKQDVPLSTSMLPDKVRAALKCEPMGDTIAAIEDLVSGESVQFGKNLDISKVDYLRRNGVFIPGFILNNVTKLVTRGALLALLTSARSRLLELLLELRGQYPELDSSDDASRVNESEIDEAVDRRVYQNCTVIERQEMRDSYTAGQAGNQGPSAKIDTMNVIQILRGAISDSSLGELAVELERLRQAMLSESRTAEQDAAVAAVAEAEGAAKRGDAGGVLAGLKTAGKWALDTTTRIGTSVAAKAIEKAMGM